MLLISIRRLLFCRYVLFKSSMVITCWLALFYRCILITFRINALWSWFGSSQRACACHWNNQCNVMGTYVPLFRKKVMIPSSGWSLTQRKNVPPDLIYESTRRHVPETFTIYLHCRDKTDSNNYKNIYLFICITYVNRNKTKTTLSILLALPKWKWWRFKPSEM